MKTNHLIALLSLCGALNLLHTRGASAGLEQSFLRPPAAARPWVYWFIMDGNFTREGITADLEAMQRAGLGGLVLMEVNVGLPRGPVKFMSEEWRSLFQHAVEEAERLGLEITLNAGPGWTGSGGPWVKPEQSMQHLVASATEIAGPSRFDAVLPRAAPRPPYFGKAGLTPEMIQAQESFHVDVAVLAFPTPTQGAFIAESDEKALYLRHPYSSRPGTKPFLPSPAAATADPAGAIPRNQMVDLSGRMQPNGRLAWEAPPGRWTILRFGRTSTGANTRPAPQPGLGLECDKFDPAALEAHFEAFVGSLLRAVGPRPNRRTAGWTMLHIDSWEMGAQNWTAHFREAFGRRRGYDPLPYLPAYTGRVVESPEVSERFLWDVRLTGQELVLENHAQRLKELGRQHGFGLSIEPYDMNPTADLALGAVADVPMCEFWAEGDGFLTAFTCLEATSIAHTHGRPIVAAEAFTSAGGQSWVRHPGSMKNQADWALAAGINRLVFHRYAHQPWPKREPGMTMGPYGTQYERTQTWWEMSGAWHEYLARCQHLLRQGLPVADILYLTPEGAPHVFRPPPSALAGSAVMPDRKGYSFDGCDPQTLLTRVSVQDGRLVLPDGMSYRVLVLPAVDTMTPALLGKVKALLEAGAVVVGSRPSKSPSLSGYPRCDLEVRRLAEELWGTTPAPDPGASRKIGAGRLVVPVSAKKAGAPELDSLYGDYSEIASLLAGMGVNPDFESDHRLRYIHRQVGQADFYFVSNPSRSAVSARCVFRVAGKKAEWWDPVGGQILRLPNIEEVADRTRLTLALEPHGSVFVVFRPATDAAESGIAALPLPSPLRSVAEIPGPWEIHFQPGRGAPEMITLERLHSWSDQTNSGVKYFSGVATYRKTIQVPKAAIEVQAGGIFLDLGRVEVMAEVTLNQRHLGTLWCAPFRVEISSAVKPGDNELEIKVVNLWPNRMIGDAQLPADLPRSKDGMPRANGEAWPQWLVNGQPSPNRRITFAAFDPFRKDSKLLPSGLLGPVQWLVAEPRAKN